MTPERLKEIREAVNDGRPAFSFFNELLSHIDIITRERDEAYERARVPVGYEVVKIPVTLQEMQEAFGKARARLTHAVLGDQSKCVSFPTASPTPSPADSNSQQP